MNQSQHRPRSHSQSHLISLANLLQSAEARHSAVPLPPDSSAESDDSGLIDLLAMERRAREERAALATRTPVPVVASVHDPRRPSGTEGDYVAALDAEKLRKKRILIGGAAAGALLLVVLLGFAVFGGSAPPPVAAVAPVPVAAPAAVAPPAVPVVAAVAPAAPAAEPVAAADPEPAAPTTPHKKKKHKAAAHGTRSGAKQSLMKVLSGGT